MSELRKVMDDEFEKVLKDPTIAGLAYHATRRFVNRLSGDEIHSCVLNAIWKSIAKYNDKKGTKFSTYLHRGIVMECLSQLHFNERQPRSLNSVVLSKDNPYGHIDFEDLIDSCKDSSLIRAVFLERKSFKELAKEHGVSSETIRQRVKKNLETVKTNLV